MSENIEKINKFKIEKVEQRSKEIRSSEVNSLLSYTCCALEVGFAIFTINPIFLCAALGYLTTAQIERNAKKEWKTDLQNVKNIKNENDFEKYKIKRVEKCDEELKNVETPKKVCGVVTALALAGMFLAPAVSIVPLYVGIYGFLHSKIREWTAKEDKQILESMKMDYGEQEQNSTNSEPIETEEENSRSTGNSRVKRKLLPSLPGTAIVPRSNGGVAHAN